MLIGVLFVGFKQGLLYAPCAVLSIEFASLAKVDFVGKRKSHIDGYGFPIRCE